MQFEGKVIRQLNEGMLRVGECAMARETQINSTISHSITIYNETLVFADVFFASTLNYVHVIL